MSYANSVGVAELTATEIDEVSGAGVANAALGIGWGGAWGGTISGGSSTGYIVGGVIGGVIGASIPDNSGSSSSGGGK